MRCRVAPALFLLVAMWVCAGGHALGQGEPTASRAGDLQFGGGVTLGESKYNLQTMTLIGGSAYGTFDFRFSGHWGVEANFHELSPTQDSTVYERTYEVGPRYHLAYGPIVPYAKILLGRGVYNYSNSVANVAYNMYTFGGGADFRVRPSLSVRADYEYQNWIGFPLGTLHPSVVTIGVAYHFHE